MTRSVYFDSSVFLSVFMADASAVKIRELLTELKREKVRIYTSIVTIQEVSVLSYRKGTKAEDNYAKVDKLARIEGVTKDVALTAAKLEANIIDQTLHKDREDNKRRKWDCFHIATAMVLECGTFYSCDEKQLRRKGQFNIAGVLFMRPEPSKPPLPFPGTQSQTGPPIQ
ncbi:MAG TPA: type II toxin-antitoxin system VapC family toxin [Acidobacteriaceae bacterium]|jgi:predicted nucleic acid-binding protein|nr:type II toxin-antitoxin system VapC family toxin [Acidobacteriaceae bacterium]